MVDLPRTMKAWVVVRAGRLEDVLELKTRWPAPAPPKTGEVMIRVSYAAINPGDIKMAALKIPFRRKSVIGMDLVGEVVQVGPPSRSTLDVRIGMVVAGTMNIGSILRGAGALADYVVLPADLVVEKPPGLEESVAAGLLGVAGQTSVAMLRAANLHAGDKVLVNGASGGVGSILIQVLRGMGVYVVAICSAKNEALVRRLGAEEVVDYTAPGSLYDRLSSISTAPGNRPFDAAFDCVGNEALYHRSPGYLKPDGRYLNIEAGPFWFLDLNNWWPVVLGGTPRAYVSVFSNPSGSSAKTVVDWFQRGWLREVQVDSVFDMADTPQAYKRLATQRAVGKICVKVR